MVMMTLLFIRFTRSKVVALLFNVQAFFYADFFFAEEVMELAAEKWDGGDGAKRDNRDGNVGDSWLVDLRPEKESQNQDDPPVDCKNYERIAGNVAEDSLENADGCNVWNLACEQERGDEADNACDGTCDKLGKAFAQVVVHDAEIRTRRFQERIGDKA